MQIVSSLEEIIAAAAPERVELSGWQPGQKWAAQLRRPSLVNMAVDGDVPNPLLGVVSNMLAGGAAAVKAGGEESANAALKHIVRAALKQPTLAELEAAGVELTDDQYMEIYAWVLGGLDGLARFRRETRGGADQHDAGDAGAAERDAGDHGELAGVVPGRSDPLPARGAEERAQAEAREDQG